MFKHFGAYTCPISHLPHGILVCKAHVQMHQGHISRAHGTPRLAAVPLTWTQLRMDVHLAFNLIPTAAAAA